MILREGMREGDLEDIVLPLISVDEFKSKVDDDAVVFGFYVSNQDAARDLNRFIQKSPVQLLDTDVSPAPDQQGNYLVFFEILNNDRCAENVAEVLDEVTPLTKIGAWQLRVRGVDRLIPFSEAALASHLKDIREETDKKKSQATVEGRVLTFLKPSLLSSTAAIEGRLIIEGLGDRAEFEIIEFGDLEGILAEHEFGAIELSMTDVARELRLTRMLGEGWSVCRMSGLNVLLRSDSDEVLLLRDR